MKKFPKPIEFFPINKNKYKGTFPIIARSSWELKAFRFLDLNPNVIKWGSESVVVEYEDPTRPINGKPSKHRYFIDLNMTIKNRDGKIKTYLVEIKPEAQCKKPIRGNKKEKTFINESMLYIRNLKKWESAYKFANSQGFDFMILTEKHLGILD